MKLLLIVLTATLLMAFQEPQSDQPEFPGQPKQCDNYRATPEDMKCHCARDRQKCNGLPEAPLPVTMDKNCKTYCVQQHCNCRGMGCRS